MTALATLVVAAVVGYMSGLLLQRQRQEREELHWLRDRMLTAADDFANTASRVTAEIGAKASFNMNDPAGARTQLASYRVAITEASARLPRLDLLFGSTSEVARAARAEVTQLNAIRGAAEAVVESLGTPDYDAKVSAWFDESQRLPKLQAAFREEATVVIANPRFPSPPAN